MAGYYAVERQETAQSATGYRHDSMWYPVVAMAVSESILLVFNISATAAAAAAGSTATTARRNDETNEYYTHSFLFLPQSVSHGSFGGRRFRGTTP
jgi:hypothetical protein